MKIPTPRPILDDGNPSWPLAQPLEVDGAQGGSCTTWRGQVGAFQALQEAADQSELRSLSGPALSRERLSSLWFSFNYVNFKLFSIIHLCLKYFRLEMN